jgi:very-short-patch-repair endonuclease
MSLPYDKNKIPKAKQLRKNMTAQERKLWYQYLSRYPVRFQRQKTIGGFIADFYCAKAHLVIEADGGQHYDEQGKAYDMDRTTILRQKGLEVIRFSNESIDTLFHEVCRRIDETVQSRIKSTLSFQSLPPS